MSRLRPLLEDLENRIDTAKEDNLWCQWQSFWQGRCDTPLFQPVISRTRAPGIEWPTVHINDAIADDERMVISQLCGVSNALARDKSGSILSVRANYGVGILPSIFGAELFMMPRHQACLPNSLPLPGGTDGVKKALDKGIPDPRTGLGARVLDTGELFVQSFADFPKVKQHVHIYHPDLQGPMDVAELLWGTAIFVELFDQPQLVHDFLKLICETYITFMKEWWKISPPLPDLNPHWTSVWKGNIVLRDDSAMNLSPEMFKEFILPYDEWLLKELGGGAIHACGRVDHWVEPMSKIANLYGFNMSQPSYNDMETVYQHTVDKNIKLVGLDRGTAEEAVAAGHPMLGRAHCG